MSDPLAACEAIFETYDRGEISAEIASMEMLIASEDAAIVRGVVDRHRHRSPRARALADLVAKNEAGCARVAAMLRSGVDSPPQNGSIEEGIAFCRTLFDWSVRQSEEASVALYSLGSPSLLAEATREITELFAAWNVIGADRDALDIGCGIGRLEEAFAPHLRSIYGIDVSTEMIATAKRRCASLANATFTESSGADLALFADESFDLVFAVDSFPYLVQSGMALVDTHFAEVARVLRPGGDFVILNFSYRASEAGTPERADEHDARRLASTHGFELLVCGATPFTIWNGAAFRMKKPQPANRSSPNSRL